MSSENTEKSIIGRLRQKEQQHRRQPLIRNSSLWINSSEADPMSSRFRIASTDFLDEITERGVCVKCLKSRKYYCYSCFLPLDSIKDRTPKVRLPVKVDIIKHIQEVDGKSTCAHAAIIAPEECTVYYFPDIPDWTDLRTVLVFPGPNAQTLNQLFDNYYQTISDNQRNESTVCNGLPFDRVIFIDSTWRQTKQILSDPRVDRLTKSSVLLSSHESLFWRHQCNTPRTYLSTIEAIYYFFCDLHQVMAEREAKNGQNCGQYDYRFDNLLFFFKHTYNQLRQKYNI